MGKGGGRTRAPLIPVSPAETAQAENIKWIQEHIQQPIVGAVLPRALGPLSNAFETQLTAPERQNIEDQYAQAQNQIYNQAGARGGMLQKQMSDLAIARANEVANATNNASQRGIERALGLLPAGFPGASATLSAGGQLAQEGQARNNLQAQLNAQAAQQAAQQQQGLFGGIGNLIGGLFGGGGWGSALGTIGSLAGSLFSSRSLKADIEPFEHDVLAEIESTPVYTWRYKGDDRTHLGPVTEEAPKIMVSDDGMALVPIDYMGYLFTAIKQLSAKVTRLEALCR